MSLRHTVKHLFSVMLALTTVFSAAARPSERPPEIAWIRQLGSSTLDFSNSLAVDGSDNMVIAGDTDGSLGGPSAGYWDAYVAKYSAAGVLLWTRQIGEGEYDGAWCVAVDDSANVFIAGTSEGSMGGANAGESDAFVAKFDASGTLLWIRQLGTNDHDGVYGIAVDEAGQVFIAGYTRGNLGGPYGGNSDAFIAKYSASGDQLWTRQLGTSSYEFATSLALDGAGHVFVAGQTEGSLGGPSAGSTDAFIAKYSVAGDLLWIRQLGTSTLDYAKSVAVDGSGNALMAGSTIGSLGEPNAGDWDAFVAKYSAAGDMVWTRQLGTSNEDFAHAICIDATGNAFVVGMTKGNLGGLSAGNRDVFIAKFAASGSLLWTHQIGTVMQDRAESVVVNGSGHTIVTGCTLGNLGGPNAGACDTFIVKYGGLGDLNGDGVVNVSDLLAVISAWGPCPRLPESCPADVAPPGSPVPPGDSVVNVQDLLAVISNWG